jgi:hypothetical protein
MVTGQKKGSVIQNGDKAAIVRFTDSAPKNPLVSTSGACDDRLYDFATSLLKKMRALAR